MSRLHRNELLVRIGERRLSVIVFALFFSWLLAFPFEGQILYSLADQYQIDPHTMIFSAITATFLGLFLGGFLTDNIQSAKRILLFSILVCVAVTVVFLFPPSILWNIAIIVGSFAGGACVALWGFFYKSGTPPNERLKTAASGLIYSNIVMIVLNMSAIHLNPTAGLILSILVLAATFFLSIFLPESETNWKAERRKFIASPGIKQPLFYLCVFIVVITINSGLMYQVINPAYAQYEWLVSWYWAIPYIIALYIMKQLPRTANRTYILYVGIAMIGFAFLLFMNLEHSVGSYFAVDTLMLGACGIYDLFWWSILGEMLDWGRNPSRILGIGLSSNVFGVLLGGLIGNGITASDIPNINASMIALAVVFFTLMLLPILHKHLKVVLKDHVYLEAISVMTPMEHRYAIDNISFNSKLTDREKEITGLLLEGKTNRMIAAELSLSENTIKTHVKNIYSKLEIQSRMELAGILLGQQYVKIH